MRWKLINVLLWIADHFVVDKDGVVIRGVTDEDEGVYTCRVRVVQLGTVEERHIKVEVRYRVKVSSDFILVFYIYLIYDG